MEGGSVLFLQGQKPYFEGRLSLPELSGFVKQEGNTEWKYRRKRFSKLLAFAFALRTKKKKK